MAKFGFAAVERSKSDRLLLVDELNEIVTALGHIRTKYGGGPRSQRRRLLRAASRCRIGNGAVLVIYHEILLFLCAFPDDRQMLDLTLSELRRVRGAVKTITARGRRVDLKKLEDSGIAETVSHCQFSVQTATWLAEHYHRDSRNRLGRRIRRHRSRDDARDLS